MYSWEQWNKLLDRVMVQVAALQHVKGQEYSGDVDRLRNFRRAADELGLRQEVIWRVYAGKHWDAITTYVADLVVDRARERSEPIEGRVLDLIVYLLLFLAMCEERNAR
jgi:hypothetical protein